MNASRNRKIVYLLVIVALFSVQIVVGGWLDVVAKEKKLAQESLGDVDPVSGTAQLVCFGFRGVAVTFLWNEVIDLYRKERWFEIRPVLTSITKLQPNFTSPWQYQAWNMAYNIAAQWESVKDKFYWMAEGGKFMREACEKNQQVSDLEWYVGYIYHNRFSVSDEVSYLREMFRLYGDEKYAQSVYEERKKRGDKIDEQWLRDLDQQRPVYREFFLADRRHDPIDPMDCAYYWFNKANKTVLDLQKQPKRMGITPFMSHPAKAKTTYAEFLAKEGHFGRVTREAWREAYVEWLDFGKAYGWVRPPNVHEREALLHRLEYEPQEWKELSEESRYWVDRYGNIVRYQYWKNRVKAEATEEMESAREAFFKAEKAREQGDYLAAKNFYEEAFPKWRKVLLSNEFKQVRDDIPIIEDSQMWESNYLKLLNLHGWKVPEKRPFDGLFAPYVEPAKGPPPGAPTTRGPESGAGAIPDSLQPTAPPKRK